jgi:hypothetical protein
MTFKCKCGRKHTRPTCDKCIAYIKLSNEVDLFRQSKLTKETPQIRVLNRLNPENLVIRKEATNDR